MKMLYIAGLLITLPAIVVVIFALIWNEPWWMIGAAVSFGVNFLPFLAALFILRAMKNRGHEFGHGH